VKMIVWMVPLVMVAFELGFTIKIVRQLRNKNPGSEGKLAIMLMLVASSISTVAILVIWFTHFAHYLGLTHVSLH